MYEFHANTLKESDQDNQNISNSFYFSLHIEKNNQEIKNLFSL